ncbi:hypothetical protein [Burkholderia ubonensis]|uniref:hypothetical protein n=1 Tax=Burkholderia ubonensis TaxID=101571 RepID=UPI00075D4FFB|nr:hypothetical protein [Burkholderia ubonensis]KWC29193.1 hypothetical protein WL48_25740 [Burkholderia ubonensis]KWC31967.1 hypothetical protein WL49_26135 [Burkholderia ubonensis]OJA88397.1 hypothetical protein BGV48_25745 [Burkholderia ubonensis]
MAPIWTVFAVLAAAALVACGDDSSSAVRSVTNQPIVAPTSNPASMESEQNVFARVAPADKKLNDPNLYDTTKDGSIALSAINEDSSVKRRTITIDGKILPYVARAGHLIAYRGTGINKKAEAAI